MVTRTGIFIAYGHKDRHFHCLWSQRPAIFHRSQRAHCSQRVLLTKSPQGDRIYYCSHGQKDQLLLIFKNYLSAARVSHTMTVATHINQCAVKRHALAL